nr:CUE domain-containing protein 1 isoform X1 [Globicephala melas]XP_030737518.1 CUE domain-containing protein 1 isoform X1 [Globicephala melas]XP_030737519.1 CUE domain-containing protein 1 isoform X1 [Globicephala melas]XP_030737520.1 CUE domain-containing protein 1 isoform X1 [Globicephala melas]XP_030737521.1 CUE domain-containing protein 1 isoform X1 [Globicephala melas]
MTSLFRRSGGGGGGGGGSAAARGAGGSAAASQELNNSRPARQVRRLEFNQAMDDFKTMFPNMDYDIIECVLRANSGAVDATIDQLLQMNLEAGGGSVYEDSSDSEDSIPPEILERTLEPDSSDEEPPPVYSPPAYHMHMFDRPYPLAPPTPPPRIDVLGSAPPSGQRRYRNWNPPLLGNLPEDFLRILPQQLDSIQATSRGSKPAITEGGRPLTAGPGPRDQENRWKQYLEDERIALFLQNEEFMKELQRNRDFLLALERDRLKYESQKSTSSSVAVGNDFDFPAPVPGNLAFLRERPGGCRGLTPQLWFAYLEFGGRLRKQACGEVSPSSPCSPRGRWPLHSAAPGSYQPSGCCNPHPGLANGLAELLGGAWSTGKKGTHHTTNQRQQPRCV